MTAYASSIETIHLAPYSRYSEFLSKLAYPTNLLKAKDQMATYIAIKYVACNEVAHIDLTNWQQEDASF